MQNVEGITKLLAGMRRGVEEDTERLIRVLQGELRTMAARQLRHEHQPTLQPTELVDECFLKLLGGVQPDWSSRSHFFGVAARLMRQILIDRARRRRAAKRPNPNLQVTLDGLSAGREAGLWQLLAIDEALKRLERHEPRLCRLVELRFFAGLNIEETAEAMELSPATVRRDWSFARAWLHRELS